MEFNVSGIVAFPLLLHLDGSVVLSCLVDGLCLTAESESGSNDECECTFHFVILKFVDKKFCGCKCTKKCLESILSGLEFILI